MREGGRENPSGEVYCSRPPASALAVTTTFSHLEGKKKLRQRKTKQAVDAIFSFQDRIRVLVEVWFFFSVFVSFRSRGEKEKLRGGGGRECPPKKKSKKSKNNQTKDAELTEFAICNFTGAQRAVSTYWKLSDTRALFRAGGALGNAEVGDELWRARRARERELFLWVRKRKERRTELG